MEMAIEFLPCFGQGQKVFWHVILQLSSEVEKNVNIVFGNLREFLIIERIWKLNSSEPLLIPWFFQRRIQVHRSRQFLWWELTLATDGFVPVL